ncbi:UNVERIFIED_CONTAM: hypothetical protein RMT77_013085 [Armadillidium vulgare]
MMNTQQTLRRLDELCKEYNELSSQLTQQVAQGTHKDGPVVVQPPPSVNKNKELEDMIQQVKSENKELTKENKELTKENKEQIKEIMFLKDQLRRCNEHLNRYFELNGEISVDTNLPEEGCSKITRESVYKFNGLLKAYDEVIREQTTTIQDLRSTVKRCFKNMKTLEEENSKFQETFKTFNPQTYNEGDLLEIAEEAKLLLEGRDLLLSEISLLQENEKHIQEECERRVQELQKRLQKEVSDTKRLEERLRETESHLHQLKNSEKELKEALKESVPEEAHKKSVEECNRYLDKLKDAYGSESTLMKENIDKIREEKTELKQKLNKSHEKLVGVKKEAFGYKTHIRKSYSQIHHLKNFIHSLKQSKAVLQAKLRNVCRVCSKLLEDRKRLIRDLQGTKMESRKFSIEATSKSNHVGRLTIKYKETYLSLVQRLAESEGKRKSAEEAWLKAMRDISRLKRLLHSKEEALQALLQQLRMRIDTGKDRS